MTISRDAPRGPARIRFIAEAACALLMSSGFAALAGEAPADRGDLMVCSAWDVHITSQIEEFGAFDGVDPVSLANAGLRQVEARALCSAGRVKEAVGVFERISFRFCISGRCDAHHQD